MYVKIIKFDHKISTHQGLRIGIFKITYRWIRPETSKNVAPSGTVVLCFTGKQSTMVALGAPIINISGLIHR